MLATCLKKKIETDDEAEPIILQSEKTNEEIQPLLLKNEEKEEYVLNEKSPLVLGEFNEIKGFNKNNFSKVDADTNRDLVKNKYSNEIISSKYNEIYNQLEKY